MAAKAELKARLSLDTALFERGINLAHAGAARLHGSFSAISSGGTAVFAKLAAAAAALGGVAGFGLALKGAFKLGDELSDLSRRTGILPGQLLVMQQAFKDAGVDAGELGLSINRMQRNMFLAEQRGSALGAELAKIKQLSPDQQFVAIGNALNNIVDPAERAKVAMEIFGRGGGKLLAIFRDTTAMTRAAEAVGEQAEILNRAAETFDRISDQLGHVAVKIRGFFVGVADAISGKLGPLLDKMEKLDFAKIGQDFGQSLVKGAALLVGLLSDPKLLTQGLVDGLNAAISGAGNVLLAIFNVAIEFFRNGFVQMFTSLGDFIIGILLNAFKTPLASFQANLEAIFTAIQKNLHAKTPMEVFRNFREAGDPKLLDQRTQEILAQGGPRVGFTGGGQTAAEWLVQGKQDLTTAFAAAADAITGFAIKDVTGAGDSWAQTMEVVRQAIEKGGSIIDAAFGQASQKVKQGGSAAGLNLATESKAHAAILKVGTGFFSATSGESVFGKHSTLTQSEKEAFLQQSGFPIVGESHVGLSGFGRGLSGHEALQQARKDAEKREILKKLKAEEVAERSVTLLQDIATATQETADAVE